MGKKHSVEFGYCCWRQHIPSWAAPPLFVVGFYFDAQSAALDSKCNSHSNSGRGVWCMVTAGDNGAADGQLEASEDEDPMDTTAGSLAEAVSNSLAAISIGQGPGEKLHMSVWSSQSLSWVPHCCQFGYTC